jgi:hypothetical protein
LAALKYRKSNKAQFKKKDAHDFTGKVDKKLETSRVGLKILDNGYTV